MATNPKVSRVAKIRTHFSTKDSRLCPTWWEQEWARDLKFLKIAEQILEWRALEGDELAQVYLEETNRT